MATNYSLILVSDNSKKTNIRYRKTGDSHWTNLYLAETDIDKVIVSILETLKDGVVTDTN